MDGKLLTDNEVLLSSNITHVPKVQSEASETRGHRIGQRVAGTEFTTLRRVTMNHENAGDQVFYTIHDCILSALEVGNRILGGAEEHVSLVA